jgi:hypothetical protein
VTVRHGRIPQPVPDQGLPRLRELAQHLRRLKAECGLKYRELAPRTGEPEQRGYRGASTLSRAASGRALPPRATVEAFARAAGHPREPAHARVERALRAHRAAAVEAEQRATGASRRARQDWKAVRPERIASTTALARALARQRLQAGQPSLTTLQEDTAAAGLRIPRSRIDRILDNTVLPSAGELEALLAALGVTSAVDRWQAALERVQARLRRLETASFWRQVCPDTDPVVQARLERDEDDEKIKRRVGAISPYETYDDYKERAAAGRDEPDWEEYMREQADQDAVDDWRHWYPGQDGDPGGPRDAEAQEQHRRQMRDLAAIRERAQARAAGTMVAMSSKAAGAADESYVLRVELQDTEPVIWRTVQVPAALSLAGLHKVLQITMGWESSHLHQFIADDGRRFGVAEPELRLIDQGSASLADVLGPGRELVYEYDFGDCWRHRLTVEQVVHAPGARARLLGGERACPPEDAGGPDAFMELLDYFDPELVCEDCEEEREEGGGDQCVDCREMHAWIGSWKPDAFDLDKTATRLSQTRL